MELKPGTELGRDELIALVLQLRRELKTAHERIAQQQKAIEELQRRSPTTRLDDAYSLRAEEQREAHQQTTRRRKQRSRRRGRRTTQEKLDQADRTQAACPDGFSVSRCTLERRRPVWRIENGRAVLVAYEMYRGPGGERPRIPGLLPRCEYGLEILVTLAFQVFIVGLSMDKIVAQLKFFWELTISKSQADALLNRLAREWHGEFDTLCELLAVSAVVHADETGWSVNSVWALLSEKARVLVFGCRKDAETLETLLPREEFQGVLVSDDAAVYRHFTRSQKCWAHLLRKAIRLTLLEPDSLVYRRFLDGLLAVYRRGRRIAEDQRLSESGRRRKIDELDDALSELCGDRFVDESEPTTEAERDYRNLVLELVRLMGDDELFTFVLHPHVDGTNNEAERTLRGPAQDRRTGRTSKTIRGARRRTIVSSVLESVRLHISDFTLRAVLDEVECWVMAGVSLFGRLLESLNPGAPVRSRLDAVLPLPTG